MTRVREFIARHPFAVPVVALVLFVLGIQPADLEPVVETIASLAAVVAALAAGERRTLPVTPAADAEGADGWYPLTDALVVVDEVFDDETAED